MTLEYKFKHNLLSLNYVFNLKYSYLIVCMPVEYVYSSQIYEECMDITTSI